MVNRVSTSGAALLALFAGCFVSVNPAAIAGDRIEFSAASEALAVPRPERSVKQDTASAIRETLSKHHAEGSDFMGSATGNYVTIVVPTMTKTHDHFGWTAPFEQPQDESSDSGLDMFPSKKSSSTQTDSRSISTDKDSMLSKEGNWIKDASLDQSDRGLSQFSIEQSLKSTDQGQDWLSRRLDHHSEGEWSKGYGWNESKDSTRTGYEGYGQSREDFGSFYQQPFGRSSEGNQNGADDFARAASTSASRNSPGDWSDGSVRSQYGQQLPTQPTIAETFDQLPTLARPSGRSSGGDQTFTAPSRAPSAPAFLAFPQRPGSLFQ